MLPKALPLPTYDTLGVTNADWPSDPAEITHIVNDWFTAFVAALQPSNADSVSALFIDQFPAWRDLLALSWDYRTVAGKDNIRSFLHEHLKSVEIDKLKLAEGAQLRQLTPELAWIHFSFTFTTKHGVCSGIGRLVPVRESDPAPAQGSVLSRVFSSSKSGPSVTWKTHGIFTLLEDLKQYPERIGPLRETRPGTG
jgi:hypothetical protein